MGNGGIALELAHSLRGVEVGVVLGVCSMLGAHHLVNVQRPLTLSCLAAVT